MILYHGTSKSRLLSILKHGLVPPKPRSPSPNWAHLGIRSHPHVYLSECFAAMYAWHAAKTKGDKPVILKVDVQTEWLLPDEDFLVWALRKQGEKGTTKELYEKAVPEDYAHVALDSLKFMGSVAIDVVTPREIVDHRIIENEGWRMNAALGGDLSITPPAYQVLGEFYRSQLDLFFEKGEAAVINRRPFMEEKCGCGAPNDGHFPDCQPAPLGCMPQPKTP